MGGSMRFQIACVLALLCAMIAPAAAQDRQVSATGNATSTARPEILRGTVVLKAEGKDVKDALAKIATEQDSARAKLKKLNASGDAVKFADPAMGEKPLTPQQRQMQMVMAMQNRGGKKATTAPSTANVTQT